MEALAEIKEVYDAPLETDSPVTIAFSSQERDDEIRAVQRTIDGGKGTGYA